MVKQRLMVDIQAAEETRQAEVDHHHQAEIEAPMAESQRQVEYERRSEDEARRMHKEKLRVVALLQSTNKVPLDTGRFVITNRKYRNVSQRDVHSSRCVNFQISGAYPAGRQ
jgi:hypothetical protein